jgi:hypothetical protein
MQDISALEPEAQAKDGSRAMPASSFACASGLNFRVSCLPAGKTYNFSNILTPN